MENSGEQSLHPKSISELREKSYQKQSADMIQLTEIDKKNSSGEKLTTDDIRFLYQLDRKIEGFTHQATDPRIKEIIGKRDIKSDLSLVTGYSKEQISTTRKEALRGGIKLHYGDLDFHKLRSAKGRIFPETIYGDLDLRGLKSIEGLILPKNMNGIVSFREIKSSEISKLKEINPKLGFSVSYKVGK